MDISWRADRLAALVCLLALAACGGGGGGQPSAATSTPTAQVTIGPPDVASAAASTLSFNFSTNLPPVGTQFTLAGPAVKLTSTTVGASGIDPSKSRATYRGTVTTNGVTYPVFDLNIPDISLNATNVRGDGTPVTTADGGKAVAGVSTLNYTLLGVWSYSPASGETGYLGVVVNGFGTKPASVPTTGTATYNGSPGPGASGVVGAYFVPSGSGGITGGTLSGNVSLTTDFANNNVNGTLSNMTATPTGGGAATPWNAITLGGKISRTGPDAVGFGGATTTTAAPAGAGAAGFSNAASGTFAGSFYGPNAEEVGATWTLTDPNAAGGGKAAFGALAGTK
jgi:hypothetical protein